jgi:uncharacterized protein
MKIVLDTNCFISCIGKKSLYRNVFDGFLDGAYALCLSTEVLLEYEEIFIQKWGQEVTENLFARMLKAENISFYTSYFDFNLSRDIDDNKFINLYIASNSDYLVTNDTDILQLKNNPFPILNIITLQEFSNNLKK